MSHCQPCHGARDVVATSQQRRVPRGIFHWREEALLMALSHYTTTAVFRKKISNSDRPTTHRDHLIGRNHTPHQSGDSSSSPDPTAGIFASLIAVRPASHCFDNVLDHIAIVNSDLFANNSMLDAHSSCLAYSRLRCQTSFIIVCLVTDIFFYCLPLTYHLSHDPFPTGIPLGTRRCCDVESTSLWCTFSTDATNLYFYRSNICTKLHFRATPLYRT